MKKIVACSAAALALVFSASGWAQANPEAEKYAKELLTVMKYKESTGAQIKQFGKNMPMVLMQATAQALEKNTKLTIDQKRAAMAKVEKDAAAAAAPLEKILSDAKLMDEVEKEVVPVIAKNFSAEELQQIVAFYKTPAGAKMVATFPQTLSEAGLVAKKLVDGRISKQIEKFVNDHAK